VIGDLYAHKDLIFMYKYKKFESLRLRHLWQIAFNHIKSVT